MTQTRHCGAVVAAMAALPRLVRRAVAPGGRWCPGALRLACSAVAVGPQQRVVTVEVGPEGAVRVWCWGDDQSITCLHVIGSPAHQQELLRPVCGAMALAANPPKAPCLNWPWMPQQAWGIAVVWLVGFAR